MNIDVNDPMRTSEEHLAALQEYITAHTPDLQAVCEVDLHIHSFYSDGYHSPACRILEAWRRGMKAVSITDHDNFDGCAEAVAAGRIAGIDAIPGIEIIAHWPDQERFADWLATGEADPVIEPIRSAKKEQLDAMIRRIPECMSADGLEAEITEADIATYVRNGVTTKGDISVIMWQKYGPTLAEKEIAADVKEFQALYTTRDDKINVPLKLDMDLSPAAFVSRVRRWGGLPGISHPTELRKKERLGNAALEEVIEELGSMGLQTLEVDGWRNGICPETGKKQTDVFADMMEQYNVRHPERLPLLPTNGSDDHNQPGEGLELGCGRDTNLRADYGTYARVEALKKRSKDLLSA